jgi:cell wall-associated NlpC family hydrolase
LDTRHPSNHPRAINPHDIVNEARKLIGTPYRHQGRSRYGVDCVGFVVVIMETLNTMPAELQHANYGRLPRAELIEKTSKYCEPLERPEPGALLLIRWPSEKNPGHTAIYTGDDGLMIHAFGTLHRVVEHGYRGAWVKLTDSIWRLPGVVERPMRSM